MAPRKAKKAPPAREVTTRTTRHQQKKTVEDDDLSTIEERPIKKVKQQKKTIDDDDEDNSKIVEERPKRKTTRRSNKSTAINDSDEEYSKIEEHQTTKTNNKKTTTTRRQKKVNDDNDDESNTKIEERPKKKTKRTAKKSTSPSNESKENQDKLINTSQEHPSISSSNTSAGSTLVPQQQQQQQQSTQAADLVQNENSTESSDSGSGFSITIMRKIFYAAQFLQKQNKCVQSMFKLIKEVKFEEFYQEFCRNVKVSLQYDYENPKVKNILDMIATFTISIKNENLLKNKLNEDTFDEIGLELFGKDTFLIANISKTYKNLLDHILDDALIPFLNSTNVSTRLNTLYLIRKIIEHCADIEINIYNRLKVTLLNRLQDKNPNVRLSASSTLYRFQSVDDPDDNVISALRFHLKFDISPTVRFNCLKVIILTNQTFPDILSKTRDCNSKIRETAFKKISKSVDFKRLKVEQSLTLLNNGFKDRNEKVKKTVHSVLVPAWIQSYDDDIIQLLKDLDVILNVDVISKFLEVIFQYSFSMKIEKRTRLHLIIDKFYKEHLDDQSILNTEQLSPETCLFWRCLGAFLKKNEDELMTYQQPDLENKMNLRKEINSLLEAIDDLDVRTNKPVNSTKLDNDDGEDDRREQENDEQEKNKEGGEEEDRSNQSTNERSTTMNDEHEEQSTIEKELEDDSLSKANPIDLIIPNLSNFVTFFKNFCIEVNDSDYEEDDCINFEYIFKELCLFLDNYDIDDQSQKLLVVKLANEILSMQEISNKLDDYVDHLMRFISKSVFKTNEELMDYVVEITNKLEDSLENKDTEEDLPVIDPKEIRKLELTFARETVGLHDLKDKLDEALARREYDCAHGYKQQIEVIEQKMANIKHEIHKMQNISIRQRSEPEIDIDIKDHPSVHLKLIQIFGSFLRYSGFTKWTAMMETRLNKYILPGICSTDSKIRYYALNALNHACFLSSSLSARYCALYHEICTKDNENLQITALRGLIDSLIEHGLYILNPDDEPQQTTGPKSILDIPPPFDEEEEDAEQQETDEQQQRISEGTRKKSTATSMFTNTREFTKESSFLLNKSEITTPNISMCEEDEEDANGNQHHNTNNESDIDREPDDDEELIEHQADLTMKSQIIDENRTANKTQLQIEKEEEIIKQLTKFLLKFVRSGSEEIKSTSVLAICKLLLLGKIYSPLLLSELILLWYNSNTSLNIQHDIGTFLPIYCQASSLYKIPESFNGQHCLLECFMSTVENVYRLERGLQLNTSFSNMCHSNYYDSEIDVLNVIDFMLNLLEPANHAKIAIEVCEKIFEILQIEREDEYQFKEPYITKYLIRSLNSFNLFEITQQEKDRLKFLVDSIVTQARYEQLKKLFSTKIEKFKQRLEIQIEDK